MSPDYDRAIELAATAFIASWSGDDAVAQGFVVEAIRLRGGFANDCVVVTAIAKEVLGDVFERITALLSANLIPAIRKEAPAAADAVEALLGETLRGSLARIATKWPTRN